MVRAAVYVRISDDRTGTAAGVGRQQADCTALCEARGWDVAEVYTDNDLSAYSGRRRPAYDELLRAVATRQVDAVVAWHPDRLQRRPIELEAFIDLVEQTKVKVATVMSGDYDLSTASGRMSARIVGAVARAESERMGERIARKHLELAQDGKPAGGPRPYGFCADGLTPHPVEAAVVAEVARRWNGGATFAALARDLNERAVPHTRATPWTAERVRNLLASPRNAGLRVHRGQVVGVAAWPALVDRVTWERVTARRGRVPRADRRWLLVGLLCCGACGAPMKARPANRWRKTAAYLCPSPLRGGCNGTAIAVDGTDDTVEALVLERLADANLPTAGSDGAVDELAAVEARLLEVAAMYADREIDRPEYLAIRSSLDRQARDARARLAAPTRTLAGVTPRRWKALDPAGRRAVIAALVDRIEVGPAVRGRNTYDPGRIVAPRGRIDWRV